jgi:hypothetical protein
MYTKLRRTDFWYKQIMTTEPQSSLLVSRGSRIVMGVTARHTSAEELPSQNLAHHLPHHLACIADLDHLDIAYRPPIHSRNGSNSLMACVDQS